MAAGLDTIEELFHRVLAADTVDEREAVLSSARPSERLGVERLLTAHEACGDFFHVATGSPIGERPGSRVGRFELTRQIGEGGFAVVFSAEQSTPVHRTVALKIIKPGMDSRQVIARFNAERQALAMMNHPHIARVFDAGTTDAGRP
jgi:hypothetical protein